MTESMAAPPSDPSHSAQRSGNPRAEQTSSLTAKQLKELQLLLLGTELEHLRQPSADAIAAVLPKALVQARPQQDQLSLASVPTVEAAIQASVSQDANVLSEALFPIIGPATRRSIAAAIGNLVQSLNQTLEYSLSPQSIKWRIEARRTGKSFAEVVLLRTLIYQVEQVLLIHKETGLVIQHVVKADATVQDPDVVSAMLTALQDFVRDSFQVEGGGGLDTLELSGLQLWLEEGPQAVLACVIRGIPPQTLRRTLRDSVEKIHLLMGAQLQAYSGDPAALDGCRPYLEDCLQARFKQQDDVPTPKTPRPRWQKTVAWVALGGVLMGLAVGSLLNYQGQQRWHRYVTDLNQQPGIVVIDAERRWGRHTLSGLRDPLAADPQVLLAETRIAPNAVAMTWEPYLSMAPEFVDDRIQALLSPPASVTVWLDANRVLHLSGEAPEQWIQQARQASRQLGILGWDDAALVSTERQQFQALIGRIESRQFEFEPTQRQLSAFDKAALDNQIQDLKTLNALAQTLDRQLELTVIGEGNSLGNLVLGQARAAAVAEQLTQAGVASEQVMVAAIAPRPSTTPAVRFQVDLLSTPHAAIRQDVPQVK